MQKNTWVYTWHRKRNRRLKRSCNEWILLFKKELGYDDEYANICLTHSYLNNDIYCTAGGIQQIYHLEQNL